VQEAAALHLRKGDVIGGFTASGHALAVDKAFEYDLANGKVQAMTDQLLVFRLA
jgi:hypothetical protein